jgi:hypothetical protein
MELAWAREHMTELRRTAAGQQILYGYLGFAFVAGLAAQIVGYLLRPSTPAEPLGLVADLIYALGWALWTGVVVTLFVQVLPEMKRRQYLQAINMYEAALHEQGRGAAPEARRDRGSRQVSHRTGRRAS